MSTKPIIILFLAADPSDLTRLRLSQEIREIREKLQLAVHRDMIVMHERSSVRPADLSQALLDISPRVVHLSGHGISTGAIYLEDNSGRALPVDANTLKDLFSHFADSIDCVILNACYSRIQAEAIAEYIDYVIGVPNEIVDDMAIVFSIGFYQAVGGNRSIEDAYSLGCVQIKMRGGSEDQIPILYRSPKILKQPIHGKIQSVDKVAISDIVDTSTSKSLRRLVDWIQFGNVRQLEEVRRRLRTHSDNVIVIQGLPGLGKTSLLRLMKHELDSLGDQYFAIDPSSITSRDELLREITNGILALLSSQVSIDQHVLAKPVEGLTLSWFNAALHELFRQRGQCGTIYIFIDEFDQIVKHTAHLEFDFQRILGAMRFIVEQIDLPIAFVLTTFRDLNDIVANNYGSPFWRESAIILLPLNQKETETFVNYTFKQVELAPEHMEFIYRQSGGHPYILNLLIQNLLGLYELKLEMNNDIMQAILIAANGLINDPYIRRMFESIYNFYLINIYEQSLLIHIAKQPTYKVNEQAIDIRMKNSLFQLARLGLVTKLNDHEWRLSIGLLGTWLNEGNQIN